VSVTPGVNESMQVNQLKSVDVTEIVNALVTLGTQVDKTVPFSVTLPAGTASTRLTLKRVQPGQAFRVSLTATDNCGPWKTFVGAGTG
jgi:hypothetical protein